MESVRKVADETKKSGVNMQIKFKNVKLLPDGPERVEGENTRRAMEVGPVLEEILHSHWDHRGLNE